jgi:hypothetical protein
MRMSVLAIDQVRRVDLREHAVLGVAIHHGAT